MFKTTGKVQIKDSQGNIQKTGEYEKVVFEGMKLGEDGKPTGGTDQELLEAAISFFVANAKDGKSGVVDLLKELTYGYDLGVKATVRQQLMRNLAGPEKAIDRAVKDYMAARAAMGKPVTEEVARKKIMED